MRQLYCTWRQRSNLPTSIRSEFGDLDYLIVDLLSKATVRVLLIAPYLSTVGMERLRGPLAVAAENGAWIRLVTSETRDRSGLNYQSIQALLAGSEGLSICRRIRILDAAPGEGTFFHAKIVVADGKRGYLGSANFSRGGFDRNFELGVCLDSEQAAALERLVDDFEAQRIIVDVTRDVVP